MVQDGASGQDGGCLSAASIQPTCFPDGPEAGHQPPASTATLLYYFKPVVFEPVVVHCPITAFGKSIIQNIFLVYSSVVCSWSQAFYSVSDITTINYSTTRFFSSCWWIN